MLLCTLLALGGCFSLSREPTPARHYVLGGVSDDASAVVAPARTTIGLRPPRLAEYLASPFIVVRQGVHRIGFSEFDRWGEDLGHGISRAIVRRMATRAPSFRVETTPWVTTAMPEYIIQMALLRFEGVAPDDPLASHGDAHLLATWEISRRQGGALLAGGTTEVRQPDWAIGDYDALVRLLDEALDTLAAELVLGMQAALAP
jgi:uncharacterized lipoprotein YmbA